MNLKNKKIFFILTKKPILYILYNWGIFMRLFIGVNLKEDVKDKIYSNIKNLPKCYRVTKKENLHITLIFLGEVDEVFIPEIINKIKFAIKDIRIIKATLDSTGQFPEKGKGRIIYISGKNGEKELKKLATLINDNLIEFKEKKEKIEEFKFHITIARLNEKEKFVPYQIRDIEKISFDIEDVTLFKSELTREGPIYTEIWSGALLPILNS